MVYGTDGAIAHNATGTHVHVPVLAMNPHLADHLIRIAVERAGVEYTTTADHDRIDDVIRTMLPRRHAPRSCGGRCQASGSSAPVRV